MEKLTPSESFSIDDAFQSDDDERIRVYGSTNLTSPTGPKSRPELRLQDEEEEEADRKASSEPTSHLLPSPTTGSLKKSSTPSDVTHVSTRSFTEASSFNQNGRSWEPNKRVRQSISWLQHPKIRENWRVVLGAFMLTMIGSVLFSVGLGIVISPHRGMHCLVFFVGGLLCLIPGAYHLVYIYLAVKGFDGYSLYDLPVFN